jgi:hypothetical protein
VTAQSSAQKQQQQQQQQTATNEILVENSCSLTAAIRTIALPKLWLA